VTGAAAADTGAVDSGATDRALKALNVRFFSVCCGNCCGNCCGGGRGGTCCGGTSCRDICCGGADSGESKGDAGCTGSDGVDSGGADTGRADTGSDSEGLGLAAATAEATSLAPTPILIPLAAACPAAPAWALGVPASTCNSSRGRFAPTSCTPASAPATIVASVASAVKYGGGTGVTTSGAFCGEPGSDKPTGQALRGESGSDKPAGRALRIARSGTETARCCCSEPGSGQPGGCCSEPGSFRICSGEARLDCTGDGPADLY